MSVIAQKIYKKPTRVLWCGDYAEDEEVQAYNKLFTVDDLYGSKKAKGVQSKSINNDILKHKYLVNHDKRVYIDLDRYASISEEFNKGTGWEGWHLNPISLLTAVGNGRGGGDYYPSNVCYDKVGAWTYDLISLEDKVPQDYKEEKHIIFNEHLSEDREHLAKMYGLTLNELNAVCE